MLNGHDGTGDCRILWIEVSFATCLVERRIRLNHRENLTYCLIEGHHAMRLRSLSPWGNNSFKNEVYLLLFFIEDINLFFFKQAECNDFYCRKWFKVRRA